jgi:hypothetical protein
MDQVKVILRALSKHIFWIGCGVIMLVSMFSWYTARSSLKSEFDENLGKIKTSFGSADTLRKKPAPPNEHSNTQMDRLLDEALQKVVEAWQTQYSHQETILTWPRELGSDFVAAVQPLKPIELKVEFPTPPQQELKVDFRQRYANYVERLLPRLAVLINSRWLPGRATMGMSGGEGMDYMGGMGSAGMGGMGSPGMAAGRPGPASGRPGAARATTDEKPPLVVWEGSDQGRLFSTHFDWSGQQDQAPNTLQLLYAQEDLWVLTALMYIIRNTNGEVEARHEAVVKTIEAILIGRGAVGRAGQITRLGGASQMGGMGMEGGMGGEYGEYGMGDGYDGGGMMDGGMGSMGMMDGGMGSMGMMDGGMGSMGMMDGGMDSDGMMGPRSPGSMDPANFRYVDNEYMPLPAQRIRDAMQQGSPEDAFLVVAKRMPVRLRLVVDQRRLHRLLAQFGNSLLPVEIRQVRVNPPTGGAGFGGGMGMGGMGMGGMGMGGMDMGGMGMGGMGMGGMDMGGMDMGGMGMGGMGYDGGMGMGGMGMGGMMDEGAYGEYGSGMGGMASGGRGRQQVGATSRYDVPVEVYGIIYIYNPVDRTKLGVTQAPTLTGTSPAAALTAG